MNELKGLAATVVVPIDNLNGFNKRLNALNVKAQRFGLDIIVAGEPRHASFLAVYEDDPKNGAWTIRTLREQRAGEVFPRDAEIVRALKIDIEYPIIKLGEWSVIAKKEIADAGALLFVVTGDPADSLRAEVFRDCAINCEHCKTNRQRKNSYILKNDSDDSVQEIGSSCLEDFTGIDPSRILFLAKMYEFISLEGGDYDPEGGFASTAKASSVGTSDYLARVSWLADTFGFTSASKARETGNSPTYSDARSLSSILENNEPLAEKFDSSYEHHRSIAEQIRNWYSQLSSESSFDLNVKALLAADDILLDNKHLAFAAAAIPSYHRHLTKLCDSTAEKKISNHLGAAGDKLKAILNVVGVSGYETQWGWTSRINFRDDQDNNLTWVTSSAPEDFKAENYGKRFDGTFKVKGHSEFNGSDVTEITHLKIKNWIDRDFYMLRIKDTSTAAFEDIGCVAETSRILHSLAEQIIESHERNAIILLRDTNGNVVGDAVSVMEPPPYLETGEIRAVFLNNQSLSENIKAAAHALKGKPDLSFLPFFDEAGEPIGSLDSNQVPERNQTLETLNISNVQP